MIARTKLSRSMAASLTLASVSLVAAGCGGGANSDVKVTMKSSESMPVAGETATNGAAADRQPPQTGTGQPGRLIGTITYDGTPPSLSPAASAAQIKPEDANVCRLEVIGNDSLVVNPQNKGVRFVFVYLEKAPTKPAPQDLEPVTFDNKNCRFDPHAVFVQVGQTMHVHNSDPILHNTHTYPKRNTLFNQAINPRGAPLPFVYTKPEPASQPPVEVKCDLHVWMKGYHLVLDHPWGAVTDADGRFELPELPPGKYQFRIWHEKPGYLERKYTVTIDGDTEVKLSYGPAKFARFEGPRPKTVYLASR